MLTQKPDDLRKVFSRGFHRSDLECSSQRVLLVEPDGGVRGRLRETVREVAHTDGDSDFRSARTHLFSRRYDWLVTNIRLDAYNGLHLIHLAETAHLPMHFLVYADRRDLVLAREAQEAGAFYESRDHVQRALAGYLRGTLPARDRRNPAVMTRHSVFRGGRRSTDSLLAASFAS
jgi:DNA-binding NtrC family response regulator